MSSWIGPPVAGHVVRFEKTVSKPPQGKLGAVSSSKPRAGGQLRRKWAEVRGRRERRARVLCMVAVFFWRRVECRATNWDYVEMLRVEN
jgi:hypothetical protein